MNGLTAFESETTINFNEDEATATVYTASKRVADLLIKRGIKPDRIDRNRKEVTGWFFTLPRHSVILKPAATAIRLGGRKINSIPLNEQQSCVLE